MPHQKLRNDSDLSDPEKKEDGYYKMIGFLQEYNIPHIVINTENSTLDEVKEMVDEEIEKMKCNSKNVK